jgi:chromosome segregation ATPase
VNPFGSNKKVYGWLKNDSGETGLLTIDFPYKTFGWYINDEEGNKIASLLTSLGAEHQNIVRANKIGANSAASEYKSAKPLENAANGDEAKLKAEIANQEKKLEELNTSYTTSKSNLETAQKEVVSLRNQLSDKEKNVDALNFSINTTAKDMNTIKENIETLKKGNASVAETKAKYSKISNDALNKLNTHMSALRVEAPPRQPEINAGETAVKNLNTQSFVDNLNKIHPTQ